MSSVVITGGSRGIGAAVATACAEMGWDVALSYVSRSDAAAEVVAACEAVGVGGVHGGGELELLLGARRRGAQRQGGQRRQGPDLHYLPFV